MENLGTSKVAMKVISSSVGSYLPPIVTGSPSTASTEKINNATASTDVEIGSGAAPPSTSPDALKPRVEWPPLSMLVVALCSVVFCTSLFSLLVASFAPFVYFSLVGCAVASPLALFQHRKLYHMKGFIEVENRLRKEVNKLAASNKRLNLAISGLDKRVAEFQTQNSRLESTVDDLSSLQESLNSAAAVGTENADAFKLLLNKNREILKMTLHAQRQTTANLDAQAVQNMVSLVLTLDADQSGSFDDGELELIGQRMESM